jgi:hypothetical protein
MTTSLMLSQNFPFIPNPPPTYLPTSPHFALNKSSELGKTWSERVGKGGQN